MSSASSSGDGHGVEPYGGGHGGRIPGRSEDPSPSRMRRQGRNTAYVDIWPEPFLEALAVQVAVDASRSFGSLAAAHSLVSVFQVCSTWRAVSRSELLWAELSQQVWARPRLSHPTWRDEYLYWHRTASNFRLGRSIHTALQFDPSEVNDHPEGMICRCLALSEFYLACGFADGAVRLFDLVARVHIGTYRPHHPGGLGLHPRAVSGIILSHPRLVFATLDGDIHIVMISMDGELRRAHIGNVVNDGALVDFSGCRHWWVGLYAGVPGRAFHIWNGETEEVVFIGGSLTDLESLMGWRMLTELTQFVGRVRVTDHGMAVACTNSRVIHIDLRNQGIVLDEQRYRRGVIVTSMDVNHNSYMIVDSRGVATVRHLATSEQVCRFMVRGAGHGRAIGCVNLGYAIIGASGAIGVWGVERGEFLYSFGNEIGIVSTIVADNRYVVAYSSDTTIHLWDYGAR